MATKQQVREQITKVIQEGILTQVLPYQSISGEFTCTTFNGQESYCDNFGSPCSYYDGVCNGYSFCYQLSQEQIKSLIDDNYFDDSGCENYSYITAETYQSIVGDDGQIQVQENATGETGEQVVIYQEDFQTAENDFNRFVDGIVECYTDPDGTIYDFDKGFTMGNSSNSISFEYGTGTIGDVEPKIFENLGVTNHGVDCAVEPISLKNAMIALTQFQSLSNTSTQIDPTQAQEILDTTIFELITQQTTKQQRINQFFQDYTNLRSSEIPVDDDNDGVADGDYDIDNDISSENPDGSIVRLNENAGDVNQNQTLEWLRDDLNNYFSDDSSVEEDLQIYQERSSGYLKFREMNQAIIIRNTENQQVIPDTWIDDGFTITMWVKFKDKVSSGTLFNYGNPLRESQPFGFMLETLIENEERYLRLVVQDGDTTIDSHIGIVDADKVDGLWDGGNVNQLVNVPTDFNEWYFIVATFDTFDQSVSNNDNKNIPLFWTGNLTDPTNPTSTTHYSGLGNRCKVEIISKTDLLRARGYQT